MSSDDIFSNRIYFPGGRWGPRVRLITPEIRQTTDDWINDVNNLKRIYGLVIKIAPDDLAYYRQVIMDCYHVILNYVLQSNDGYVDLGVLQCMALAALSIAIKTTMQYDFTIRDLNSALVYYTDNACTARQVIMMELDMLDKTNWVGCHGVIPSQFPVPFSEYRPTRRLPPPPPEWLPVPQLESDLEIDLSPLEFKD